MKKMLNEWKEFLNENKGEDYYVRKMTPADGKEYFKMIMSDGNEYLVEYDTSTGRSLVFDYEYAGQDISEMADDYIDQDLPYDQERHPKDGEKGLDPEKISQARLAGATDYREHGSMEQGDYYLKTDNGDYFEEYEDAYYTAREEEDRQDYYRDLEDEE